MKRSRFAHGFSLGEHRAPVGGRPVQRETLPARPGVVDGGVEFEPVWYPHRDAASLLPDSPCTSVDARVSRGVLHNPRGAMSRNHKSSQRWSWLG